MGDCYLLDLAQVASALTQERRWIWQPLGRDTARRISLRLHEAKNYFANTSCKVFKVIAKVLAETLPIFFANRTLGFGITIPVSRRCAG